MAGAHQVLFAGQQFRLAVVEHQAVDPFQQGQQTRALAGDIVIHGVGHGQGRARTLVQHAHLQLRRAVGQEEDFALPVALGQHGIELFHDVELQIEGLAVVHVFQVAAAPAEGLAAGHDLQPRGVDVAGLEQCGVGGGPILADHPGQPHRSEVAGGVGEEDGRSAQHVVALLAGGFHAIEGDRSDNDQRHDRIPLSLGKGGAAIGAPAGHESLLCLRHPNSEAIAATRGPLWAFQRRRQGVPG